MAPMKFEDKIREQLEERQLQPSNEAWGKLNEQLDAHKTRSNKKAYWWLGIAASVVGVLLLVTFLNKDVAQINNEPIIVDVEEKALPVDNNKEELKISNGDASEETVTKEVSKEKTKNETNQPNFELQLQKKQEDLVTKKTEIIVADLVTEKETEEKPKQQLSFEEQKAKEVVAQIKALQEKKETVTDAEIDALLNAAQKEIELRKIYDEATNKVDANALLQSVEEDLERSFRDRVFEMLSSGYKELKTAVAERNN